MFREPLSRPPNENGLLMRTIAGAEWRMPNGECRMASGIFWTVLQALGWKPSQLSRMPSRIFWAVLQAEMHSGAMPTWGFIDATVNLSIKSIQNSELMAKNGPKTCKTTQNYTSEVDSEMPARARLAVCARSATSARLAAYARLHAYDGGGNGPISRMRRSQRTIIG